MNATPPRSGLAPVNGTRIAYRLHGSGEPLLLLHGGGEPIPRLDVRGMSRHGLAIRKSQPPKSIVRRDVAASACAGVRP